MGRWPFVLLALFILSACGGGGGGSDGPISFTVAGTVTYEDKLFDKNGFTGQTRDVPVRHARIELVDANDNILTESVTDASGGYSLSTETEKSNLRVRVFARTGSGHEPAARVLTPDEADISAAKSFGPAAGSNDLDLRATVAGGGAGAFNILEVLSRAGGFAQAMGETPPLLTAYWEPGYDVFTSYQSGPGAQEGIHVLGGDGSGDTDEFDDDVIWHEYGHFAEHRFARVDSPGGVHYPSDVHQDLRLAWSEGWSNFFSGAVKAWLRGQGLTLSDNLADSSYVDTTGSTVRLTYDFRDAPAIDGQSMQYASSETAVAAVSWGLRDRFGIEAYWRAFTGPLADASPANLEGFWDGWLSENQPNATDKAAAVAILAERDVDYAPDGREPDDQLADASLGTPSDHNLYAGGGDRDLVAFDANAGDTVRIETLGLYNGTDTFIRVLRTDGNVVPGVENDNHDGASYTTATNDGCTLASRLDFNVPATDTYYVEVETAANAPASAGRYGNYTLKLSAPPASPACN